MKISNLFGERFKERPAEASLDSHALMIRGGYMRQVTNGIYSQYTPLTRITQKIETILREEMNRIDGQEVKFPVVMPADLWRKSGRYDSVAGEMVRFQDRNSADMVLGMTHEEAAVHLANEIASSYNDYPFMVYQIQTKFRDELRSRGGLIRVREFTMKDGYSFHTSQEDLDQYYDKCLEAYRRIFARAGVPEVISVAADSGMMGGKVSHEFMLLTEVGEDTIVTCSECSFSSNMEVAKTIVENEPKAEEALELIATPNATTIDNVVAFFGTDAAQLCKAVVYQRVDNNEYVIAFLRGDLDISETKLVKAVGGDVYPAPEISETSGIVAGYIGPHGLSAKEGTTLVFDSSLKGANSLICGGNKEGYHYKGFSLTRDTEGFTGEFADIANTYAGAICPDCGNTSVQLEHGIEVGNIFQLGDRYTKPMGMEYVDSNDQAKNPIMGCYGIGVGRLAASVCEVRRDDYGPIWPISIAPWQVHICAIRADEERVAEVANTLYSQLWEAGIEVILDDRDVRAGAMFSDADLLGVPVRVVVSPRNLDENVVEVTTRDKSFAEKVEVANSKDFLVGFVKELQNQLKQV